MWSANWTDYKVKHYLVIYNISHTHYKFECELNIKIIKIIYLRFAFLKIKTIHTINRGVNWTENFKTSLPIAPQYLGEIETWDIIGLKDYEVECVE